MKKSEAREGDESQRTRGTAMPHEKFNHGPPGEHERIYQATSLIALASDGISSQTRFRVFQQNRPIRAKRKKPARGRPFRKQVCLIAAPTNYGQPGEREPHQRQGTGLRNDLRLPVGIGNAEQLGTREDAEVLTDVEGGGRQTDPH